MKQHRRTAIPCLLFVLSLLLHAPAWAAHPSTVFDGLKLEQLQTNKSQAAYASMTAALQTGLNAQLGTTLTTTTDSDPRIIANILAGQALAAMILDSTSGKALAKSNLMTVLTWSDWGWGEGDDLNRGHMIIAVSIAYDVLYPLLSSSEQASVQQRLGTEAQRFSDAMKNGVWWATDYVQNHNWINTSAIGLAGYALEGEDSRAAGWVNQAVANSAKLKLALDVISDGSWHEGIGYQQYGATMAMPYYLAAAHRGTEVADQQMLRAYGPYRLNVMIPEAARTYIATHGDWSGWSGPGSGQLIRYVAAKFRDPAAQEAGNRWAAAGARSTHAEDLLALALEMIAYDPSVPDLSGSTLPLDFYAADQQLAVMRSTWNIGGLTVGLKSGVLGGQGTVNRLRLGGAPGGSVNISHDHEDDAGLWIYGDGQWLLPECVGYGEGQGSTGPWQTVYHNSFLFDGLGQLGDTRDHGDSGMSYAWFFNRTANLPLVATTASYAFARSDGTHLYPSGASVQNLQRTVGLSRDGYVVLQDQVALSATHEADQVFHFLDTASNDGTWIEGHAHNDRVLGIRVVAPANYTATITTQTASKLSKQFEPDGQVSLVQVHGAAGTASSFLEALWPTRGANWAQRPTINALDPAHPELGLSIPVADGTERWVFGTGGTTTVGDLVLTGDIGVVRLAPDGTPLRVVLVGSGSLSDQHGARLLVSNSATGVVEVDFVGTQAVLSGTDPKTVQFYAPSSMTGTTMVPGGTQTNPGDPPPTDTGMTSDVDAGTPPMVDPGSVDAGAPMVDPGAVDAGPWSMGTPPASMPPTGMGLSALADLLTRGVPLSWHREGAVAVIDGVRAGGSAYAGGTTAGEPPILKARTSCLCAGADLPGLLALVAGAWVMRRRSRAAVECARR